MLQPSRMIQLLSRKHLLNNFTSGHSWTSFVYYIYTGTINFAPLKSRGLEARLQAMAKHTASNPHSPSLCSPKSMYRLADKIGLSFLKTLALSDLTTQLTSKALIEEIFSHFTARFQNILDIEVQKYRGLKQSELDDTSDVVQRKIGEIVKGEIPYASNALLLLIR